jgi:hypothetical protein
VFLGDDSLVVGDAPTSGHGEIRKESEGRDESCQDMEHAFLLNIVSYWLNTQKTGTYDWDTEGHGVESQRGESHYDDDNPGWACQ